MKKNILLNGLVIFALAGFYIFFFVPKNSSNDSSLNSIKSKNIKSIVLRITIDYKNHGVPYLVYENKQHKDSVIIYRTWENKIEVGDSIIKFENSLNLTIKNALKKERFSYENQDLELPNPN